MNLKEFRRRHQTRPLTFASPEDLMAVLGLIPGAVTPFGVLNDQERKTQVYLDEGFLRAPGLIGVHPNDNTATVWLKTEDFVALLRGHGASVHVVEI